MRSISSIVKAAEFDRKNRAARTGDRQIVKYRARLILADRDFPLRYTRDLYRFEKNHCGVAHIFWLDEIEPQQRELVGDKIYHLSYLKQKGYPVVPGFAIATSWWQEFWRTQNWLEPLLSELPHASLHLNADDPRQLQAIARHVRQGVRAASIPTEWVDRLQVAIARLSGSAFILRPSLAATAEASRREVSGICGLLEAHTCRASAAAIATALKKVWAELFRARSLYYWQRRGIPLQQLQLAVLVQPLMATEVSGTLQALAPEEASEASWAVRAIWGLGKALVAGEAIPDYYRVDGRSGRVLYQQLGRKVWAYEVAEVAEVTEVGEVAEADGDSCLQSYLLPEDEQNMYALAEERLHALAHLAKQVAEDLGQRLYLEWLFSLETPDRAASWW